MRKIISLIISLNFAFTPLNAQKSPWISYESFLDFEFFSTIPENDLLSNGNFYFHQSIFTSPKAWIIQSENCLATKDSIQKINGDYSLKIYPENNNLPYKIKLFHCINEYTFNCDSIQLTGKFKIENKGKTNIHITISQKDTEQSTVYSEINNQWTYFELKIKNLHPNYLTQIIAEIEGEGNVWLDNFSILLDGIPIDEVYPPVEADFDHEFDYTSKIDFKELKPLDYLNLQKLCLVWGFLKYYHPLAVSGKVTDWNYELFRILPQILECKTKTDCNIQLYEWINKLENNFPLIKEQSKDSIIFHPDLYWINEDNLGKALYSKLTRLQLAEKPYQNYYVRLYDKLYPIFLHEPTFDNIKWNDFGYRILSVFRYWNMINYFHPYRPYFKNDWQKILPDYIQQVVTLENENEFNKILHLLISETNDAHTSLYHNDPSMNFYMGLYDIFQLPFEGKVCKEGLLITGFWYEEAEELGIHKGDIITHINNTSIKQIRKEKDCFFPHSNENGMINIYPLLSTNTDTVLVRHLREHKEYETLITELYDYTKGNYGTPYSPCPIAAHKSIDNNIYYINPMLMDSNNLTTILDSIKQVKGLILDLREYPIDNQILSVLADFLLENETVYAYSSYSDLQQPGVFRKNPNLNEWKTGKNNPEYYKGKTVILVNEQTISMAEIIAMLCQNAPNSIVIGSMTRGVLGNAVYFPFIENKTTRLTGIGVYYPNGKCTFPEGIALDKEIFPLPQMVANGIDEVLEYAISYLKEQ